MFSMEQLLSVGMTQEMLDQLRAVAQASPGAAQPGGGSGGGSVVPAGAPAGAAAEAMTAAITPGPSIEDGAHARGAAATARARDRADRETEIAVDGEDPNEGWDDGDLNVGNTRTVAPFEPDVDDDDPPTSYELFKPGDTVTLLGGVERTITAQMTSLLGSADNTLARIPQRFVEVSRQLVANIVLNSVTTCTWQMRERCVDVEDTMWTDCILINWNNDVFNHLVMIPEQAGKTAEMGLICLYQFLVMGCAPVVSVRVSGGRMAGGQLMEDSLNSQLSSAAKKHSQKNMLSHRIPTIMDYLSHIEEHTGHRCASGADTLYFCMKAKLKPAGRGEVFNPGREPNNPEPWTIHILLQNESNIRQVAVLAKFLRDMYGAKVAGERSRIAFINDEDDLNFSGGGEENNSRPQRAMARAREKAWANVSVTATAASILFDHTPQVYVRSRLPDNYYGIANGRVDWNVYTPEELRQQQDDAFPPLGEDAANRLLGKSGDKADFETMELAKRAYMNMIRYPNKCLAGWRHANVVLKRSDSQQFAALYMASLDISEDVVTMEWHSPSVRCTQFYANDRLCDPENLQPISSGVPAAASSSARKRKPQHKAGVRFYFSEHFWKTKVFPVWNQTKFFCNELSVRLLSLDELSSGENNNPKVIDSSSHSQHHDVVMVEMPDRYSLRNSISLMEAIWRPDFSDQGLSRPPDERSDPFGTSAPTTAVRLMVFSGDINGRQMPNKSVKHGTILTDQIYRLHITKDGTNASTSGPTASQAVSRICGVHDCVLSPEQYPRIWTTPDTKDWIEGTHAIQKELCHLQAELPSTTNLHAYLRGGAAIDRHLYPKLYEFKCKIETARNPEKVQLKVAAQSVKGARGAAKSLFEAEEAPTRRPDAPVNISTPARKAPDQLAVDGRDAAQHTAPEDEEAAERHMEKAQRDGEGNLLTSLKSATGLECMSDSRARLEPNFDEWKHVVRHYKNFHCERDEELPDFEAIITTSIMEHEIVAKIPGEVAKEEVRKLFHGEHRYQGRLLPSRLTPDAPGGLFVKCDGEGEDAWRMADFLVDKLNTLKKRRGMQVKTLSSLWKGQGVSKDDPGHRVIRAIFRAVLGPVDRAKWSMDALSCHVVQFRTFNEVELRGIIAKYKYPGVIDDLCKGSCRPGAPWHQKTLLRHDDKFALNSSYWFDELKADLNITNLYDDDWAILVDRCFHQVGRQESNEPVYRSSKSIQLQLNAVDGVGQSGNEPTERQSRRILDNIERQDAPDFSSEPVEQQRAFKDEVQRVIVQAIATLSVGPNKHKGPKAALRAIALMYGTSDGNEERPTAD